MARRKGTVTLEPVQPHQYTTEYFTTDCEGYELFLRGSAEVSKRIQGALDAAGSLRGKRILDIGCGRGELTCEAARRGAHAVGIDYSEAAIKLSRLRLEVLDPPAHERVEFLLLNAGDMSFPDHSFDVIFMVDVYEHLQPHEIELILSRIKRLLRPGGRLVIHTGPNTWFYRYGYPLIRVMAVMILRRNLRESLRGPYDGTMHVNEQSPLSLYLDLKRAGFTPSIIPRSYITGINAPWWVKAAMKVFFARPLGYVFCATTLAIARPRKR
jgi:2-polyprenyl-3-methyl-5-hydroxy-6-metoxy-1,4-benzoquinol methylase